MIFGSQREGGSRRLNSRLRSNRKSHKMHKLGNMGYSLNLDPHNRLPENQSLFTKFTNSIRPSIISLGNGINGRMPHYPPGQHIPVNSSRGHHQFYHHQPGAWPPYEHGHNMEPVEQYRHLEKPQCRNCHKVLDNERYKNVHENRHASTCKHNSPSYDGYSEYEREPHYVHHKCEHRDGCERSRFKGKNLHEDKTANQCLHFEEPMYHMEKTQTCHCSKCAEKVRHFWRNVCSTSNTGICTQKTHVAKCSKCQNPVKNICPHDQKLPQQEDKEFCEQVTQCKHFFESTAPNCLQEEPKTNINRFNRAGPDCCQNKCHKSTNSKPKTTYISHFKCPNCSYSCTLNTFPDKLESKAFEFEGCRNECCDNRPENCINFEHNTFMHNYQETKCENTQVQTDPYFLVNNNFSNCVDNSAEQDSLGIINCITKANDSFEESPALKIHNQQNQPVFVNIQNEEITEQNSFDIINCITKASARNFIEESPTLQIQAFKNAPPQLFPNQPVFLNVLQKEEVVWFSS